MTGTTRLTVIVITLIPLVGCESPGKRKLAEGSLMSPAKGSDLPLPINMKGVSKSVRTLAQLKASCIEVPTPPGNDAWYVLGYNPEFITDEKGTILAFAWTNANPASPPDTSSQQCWGSFCHWIMASKVKYWTVGYTCAYGTPGYDTVAFYAR